MEDEIRLQTLEEQIKNQDAKITEFADNFQTQFSELQQQWSDLNASLSRIATKMESWVPTMVVAEKGGHEATAKKPLLCTLEPHDRLLLEESPMALDKWEEGTLDTPLIACTVMEKCVLEEAENPEDGTKFDEKIRPVDDNADQKNLGTGGALSLLGSLYGLGEDEDSVTEDTPEIEKNASGKTNAANVPVPKSNRPYGCTSRNEQMVFDDMQFKIEDIKGSKKVIGIRMKSNKKLGKSWVENATGFTGGTIFARKYWVPYQCKMTQESAALVAVEDVGVGTWVATHSSHVTVDFAGSERVAESMKDSIPRVEWDFEGIHYLDKGPLTVQYLLVLDALNFCFWLDKELSYNHLASGLKAALEDDKSTFDADRIQKYTGPQLSKMLKWPRPLPLEDVSVDVLLDFCKLKLGVVTTKILKSWVEVVTRFKGGTFGDSYNFSRVVTSSRFTAKLIGSWHVHISWNPWLLVESDVARMTLLIPILHKLLFKHKVELNLPWDTVFNTGLAPLSRNVYGVLSRNYNFRNFFSCGTHFTLYAKTREGVLGNESVYILLALIRLVQDETEMNTLILIPLIKYVLIVLWANDHGEGGTFASSFRLKVPSAELERSLRLKERLETSLTMKKLILMLVLAGTSMVIADGVVTPAMSVMSAVGGLKVGVSGIKQDLVLMISIAFLVILFSVQRYGTSKVGIVVGPALLIWFCSLGGIGIYNLVKYDTRALKAFNPVHIYYFFRRNSTKAWYSLGGCLLCVTGSEAMFADLCYFSVRSVQLTFMFVVLPCLLLGYLGQAAYLMDNHHDTTQAFFSSVPSGAFWPVFLIANVAALIASRTMTTATFSCIKQSTVLGCFPRLKIVHTSRKFMGQIYIPVMNWFLLAASLVPVCTISNMYEIGNAYGIAELGVMMMTTILVTLVMLLIWQINIIIVLSFAVIFLGMELTFFSSVLWGVGDGSWIILVFAIVMFLIMYIWNYGSKLKYETEVRKKMSMDLLRELGPNLGTVRAPGIGLVYNELAKGIPAIFGHFLTTLPAVHSMIIFVCIKYVPVPVVPQSERFLFRRVCPKSYHIFRCVARYGYKDVRKENHQTFEQLLIESLEKFIRREAQERSLESDGDDDSDSEEEHSFSRVLIAPNGSVYSLGVPLMTEFRDASKSIITEASTSEEVTAESGSSSSDAEQSLEKELSFIRRAKESGVVYLLGHGDIRARKDSWFIKKLVINYFYAFLRKNCRRGIANLSVPQSHLMQVGMTYMV